MESAEDPLVKSVRAWVAFFGPRLVVRAMRASPRRVRGATLSPDEGWWTASRRVCQGAGVPRGDRSRGLERWRCLFVEIRAQHLRVGCNWLDVGDALREANKVRASKGGVVEFVDTAEPIRDMERFQML